MSSIHDHPDFPFELALNLPVVAKASVMHERIVQCAEEGPPHPVVVAGRPIETQGPWERLRVQSGKRIDAFTGECNALFSARAWLAVCGNFRLPEPDL